MAWDVYSLFCSLLSERQSCPIQKQGADQLCSPFSVLLLAVPKAVLSHTKVREFSKGGREPVYALGQCFENIHLWMSPQQENTNIDAHK